MARQTPVLWSRVPGRCGTGKPCGPAASLTLDTVREWGVDSHFDPDALLHDMGVGVAKLAAAIRQFIQESHQRRVGWNVQRSQGIQESTGMSSNGDRLGVDAP